MTSAADALLSSPGEGQMGGQIQRSEVSYENLVSPGP